VLGPDDAGEIAKAFELGAPSGLSGPVARGVIGQVWRLETDRGSWAVKEWFEEPALDELEEGVGFQSAAVEAGVPAPQAVRTPRGSVLASVGGTATRVQGWVDLLDPDPLLDSEGVGQLVGKLHGVAFEGTQPMDPWYTEPVGAHRWQELRAELTAAKAPFAERLSELLPELIRLDAMVVAPRQVRTCHRDLWADNLRSTTAGGLCLIDWEDCGLADPSMELALVVWEFGRTDPARARALRDAYVDAGGPGRVRGPGDFSMLIAQLGHIGARACADWLRAERSEQDRTFTASCFAEFADEPHTVEQVMTLLDAVGSDAGS
jgi:aminoglycoside phosphotransferase (APT) family kinase protein